MKKFNLISDIHINDWIKMDTNLNKMNIKIEEFVKSMLPDELTSTIVIAGDLGDYNIQNFIFLKELKNYFHNIILVFGNHDYYLVTKKASQKYDNQSINRISEMKELFNKLDNVYLLDGNTITIDGLTYGGCTMWYDLSYGLNILKKDLKEIKHIWKTEFYDNELIKFNLINEIFPMFNSEKAKLDTVLEKSDVIVTHISPDYCNIPYEHQKDLGSSFFFFDGGDYFDKIKDKIWCFGHIHTQTDYIAYDCRFINASLSYPTEENKKVIRKIKTIYK
jgi:UDP-2,3-diacylglucosamine pyrophosphatase LpxH